jgi:hypothetical protein
MQQGLEEAFGRRDVAEYLRDLSKELSRIASEAGLTGTAAAFDLAHHAAANEREHLSDRESSS